MPAFDVGRYVTTILMIGVIAGALMWMYDYLAGAFNSLVAGGMISHVGVQTATVIYWGIVAYAPVNLLFATIGALLVANARSETNSPLVQTSFSGHIILAVVIFGAFFFNMIVSGFLDPFMVGMSGLDIDFAGTTSLIAQMFSACHILSAIAVGVAYLYMILNSIRIESLQWSL